MVKKCGKCHEIKELIHFYKDCTVKSGYAWQCIICAKNKQKAFQQTPKGKEKGRRDACIHRKRHPDKIQAYVKNRKKTDVQFKLANILRGRFGNALRRKSKKGSAVKDLGCSIEFFQQYIEAKFYNHPMTNEKMTWENYGIKGWHLDHIIPLIYFDLEDREAVLKAVNYTNMQPLWAIEHYYKSPKERKKT